MHTPLPPGTLVTLLALVATLHGAPCLCAAAPVYVANDLESLRPSNGSVNGLNQLGDCVGSGRPNSQAWYRGYLLRGGTMTLLSFGPGAETHVFDLNDRGQAVGYALDTEAGRLVPFMFSYGQFEALSALSGLAMAVNNHGIVVGWETNGPGSRQAVVWALGQTHVLGTLGYAESVAMDINDAGVVAGFAQTVPDGSSSLAGGGSKNELRQRAFQWFDGTLTWLGPSEGANTVARAVNRYGHVAGSVQQPDGTYRAFLHSNGVLTVLGGSVTHAHAMDVNDHGVVVGQANFPASGPTHSHGFVYRNGVLQDLNDLIDPALGLEIITADCINNAGQIGCSAWKDNRWHAVLLNPATVELVALEVTQTVQDWAQSVPLVAGKDTVVRAHTRAVSSEVDEVVGRLRGFDATGQEFPESPLAPINPHGRAEIPDDPVASRTNFRAALNFLLPQHWTSNRVRLEMMWLGCGVYVGSNALATGVDAASGRAVIFNQVPEPRVRFAGIQWTNQGAWQRSPPHVLDDLPLRLASVFPVARVGASFATFRWYRPGKPDLSDVNLLLMTLRTLELLGENGDPALLYYGAVAGREAGDDIGGLAAGIPGHVSSGLLPGQPYVMGRHTHSHEIGHCLGRHHPVALEFDPCKDENGQPIAGTRVGACGECAGPGAPVFPFFRALRSGWAATLGPTNGVNERVFGCDTLNLTAAGYNPVISPDEDSEMMSYCSRRPVDLWVSSHTYTNLLVAIAGRFGAAPGKRQATATPQDFLLVRGLASTDRASVMLLPWLRVEALSPPEPIPAGDYAVRLLDETENFLLEIPFEPVRFHARGEDPGIAAFVLPVPLPASARQARIIFQGQTVASRSASAAAPTVALLAPNGGETLTNDTLTVHWVADDADGDSLTFTLEFSADQGAHWRALAADVVGTNCIVDALTLPGTAQGLMRITASDGWRTARDVSDSAFVVPNRPPRLAVVSPQPQALFTHGQQISCRVFTQDTEDGLVNQTNLLWFSSRDGFLGQGAFLPLEAEHLSQGGHELTVFAIDSMGATNTTSVSIEVLRQPRPQLVLERVEGGLRLSWPGWAVGFAVESALSLAQSNDWSFLTNPPPEILAGRHVLTNTVGPETRFFRLRRL